MSFTDLYLQAPVARWIRLRVSLSFVEGTTSKARVTVPLWDDPYLVILPLINVTSIFRTAV